MWNRWSQVYDRLSETQRLMVGMVVTVATIASGWLAVVVIVWIVLDIVRFFQ
jgi:hypothetical protein